MEQLQKIRSGAAIALSIALQQMFPKGVILKARATESGFACDCLFPEPIDDAVLPLIERQMTTLIHSELELTVSSMLCDNVREYLRYHGQPQRASLLASDEELVEVVRIGDYLEVIPGPHVVRLREVNAFKLLHVETSERVLADEINHPVTTISGAAFGNKQELKRFLKIADAAAEVDHRRLGRELGLYHPCREAGPGGYLWTAKGQTLRDILSNWWRKQHVAQKFDIIHTPPVLDEEMPKTRLPLHAALFGCGLRSYRELPVRYAECAALSRTVPSHELYGLFRQPSFYGDEESVFCRPDQVLSELISSLQFIKKTIRLFGFRSKVVFYVRGPFYSGTLAQWDKGASLLEEALKAAEVTEKEDIAEARLSGPKVEFRIFDALEREWSGPAVGLDFALSEQHGLRYQGKQDDMLVPMMLTRTAFGSLERIIALLLEHCGGAFPLWLAPEQVRVLPVGEELQAYANTVRDQCFAAGLRVAVDSRNERLAAKVFAAEAAKIPFIAIVGETEEREGVVTVRTGQRRQHGDRIAVDALIALAQEKTMQE